MFPVIQSDEASVAERGGWKRGAQAPWLSCSSLVHERDGKEMGDVGGDEAVLLSVSVRLKKGKARRNKSARSRLDGQASRERLLCAATLGQ